MTDDSTKDLTDSEKLNLILSELRDLKTTASALDVRLTVLESQSSGTTRPLLDRIIQETIQTREVLIERLDGMDARLEKVEKEVRLFGRKMDVFNEELLQLRHGHREIEDRVSELERRPN